MASRIEGGFKFGEWRAFPLHNEIRGPAGSEHLEPIVMQVLTYLAENAGNVVERDELLKSVWNSRAFSYEPLNRCIFELRKKLDDNPKRPKYIQTVPKRGYRLICNVALLDPGHDADQIARHESPSQPLRSGRLRSWRLGVLAGVGALGVAAGLVLLTNLVTEPAPESGFGVESSTIAKVPYQSVAVLPFSNRSTGGDDAFFVDSVHEEIISQLSQLPSLDTVISRTSVEQFRDTGDSLPDIARILGVMHILQGSVQRVGDKVRVNVQLINANGEQHLWQNAYERTLTTENIFDIQTDISLAVANSLDIVMSDQDTSRLKARRPSSLAAYRYYVLGRLELLNRDADALHKAREHFETAIDLDPGYALAYVGLADAIALQTVFGGRLNMESLPERREAIEQALRLNPNLGEAYASMGWLVSQESGMAAAEVHFARAIELSPNYQFAHQLNAEFLLWANRPEEALPHAEKSLALSPIDPASTFTLSAVLQRLGRDEEALIHTRAAIELNPRVPLLYRSIGDLLIGLGRIGEGQAWRRAGVLQAEPDRESFEIYCYGYLLLVMYTDAAKCLDEFNASFPELGTSWADVDFHGATGDYQRAAELAEEINSNDPTWQNQFYLAWSYLDNQDLVKAYNLLKQLAPDYFGTTELTIEVREIRLAAFCGYVLYQFGEIERADYIFAKAMEVRSQVVGEQHYYYSGQDIEDVLIFATRGQTQEAVAALRAALDRGWFNPIWYRSPMYDALKTEPEWNAVLDEMNQLLMREREWFETHKDDFLRIDL
jgi:TolB-like protein/DNA-binding winged helix-turn-helix (wHTH) protein